MMSLIKIRNLFWDGFRERKIILLWTLLISSLLALYFFEVSRWDKEIFRSSLLPIPGEVLNYTLFIEFVFISSEKGIPRWTSVEREANAIRIVGFNRWKNKRWKKKEVSRRRQDELSWKKTSREDSIISRMGGGHRDRKKSTPATICISTAPTCDRINNVGAKQKKTEM